MLRTFQVEVKNRIYAAWNEGAKNVMPVMATGSGKTVLFCDIAREYGKPACVIAHRQELIAQAALALTREGVPHGIIAPKAVVQQIVALEIETFGRSLYAPRAAVRAAGVDTLRNHDKKDPWLKQVNLVIQDEGHHVLQTNKWGKAMALFPNAFGLFPTAHAVRADGRGLGRHADGLVDRLVVGPCGRDLISSGFLTDYRLFCPPSDVDISDVPITDTGDFSTPKLRDAVHKSKQLVGDVVAHYLKFAAGKMGITFAVDVEEAAKIARAYKAAGVRAEVITAETPLAVRGQLMRKFRAREILQLVSVDVLGEGVDVPAIEVVSMARHTASWQLFCQQFGRALRPMIAENLMLPGPNGGTVTVWSRWGEFTDDERLKYIAGSPKSKAIIIDHVGNIGRHYSFRGLPDSPQLYSLDRREARSRSKGKDEIPLRYCLNPDCVKPFEMSRVVCPYCGLRPVPRGRSTPEQVEGNLFELLPHILAQLRKDVAHVDAMAPFMPANISEPARLAINKQHIERQGGQKSLREAIALWAGYQRHMGYGDEEIYKRFYFKFKTDIMTAQTLGKTDADILEQSIRGELWMMNVVAA